MIAEDPLFRSTAKLILYEDFPQPAGTPEYFAHYGRRERAGRTHTPYSFRRGEPNKPVFELISQQPDLLVIFIDAMVRTQDFLATRYDAYWIAEDMDRILADRALLVDGGSGGQTLKARTPASIRGGVCCKTDLRLLSGPRDRRIPGCRGYV
ncbi:hypothetical protein MMYC01_203693 [Madurella mycetomatis]|uniref:Uncharacterized protein n=1 Tax=Madurella mycetomatis TaxID=100816 RepID=A0A175W8B8_9PEZI|nr:hypothetical protein MMYC01_203693 [Madurella mycetomatis]